LEFLVVRAVFNRLFGAFSVRLRFWLVHRELRGEVAGFCEGFDVRIYRRAVGVAFAEVLGSLRISNWLIAGSIVAGGGFVHRTLVC